MDLIELNKIKQHSRRHPWEIVRAAIVVDKIKKFGLKKGTLVLDVGCGDAFFLKELNKHLPENFFVGVDTEFTDNLVAKLSNDLLPQNIQLINSIDELNTQGREIELVLLMDVIEHVPNDKVLINQLIEKVSSLQKTDFYFLITVPAFQYLFSFHDVFLKHYRRYTIRDLIKLANTVNLEILDTGYFFTSLFIARNLIALLEKVKLLKPQTEGVSAYTGGKLKTAFFIGILKVDYFIFNLLSKFGLKCPGLSAYMVCKKR